MVITTTINDEAMKTIHQSLVWLIGAPPFNLNQTKKLPLLREILSVFFYRHKELNKLLKESAEVIVQQFLYVWENVKNMLHGYLGTSRTEAWFHKHDSLIDFSEKHTMISNMQRLQDGSDHPPPRLDSRFVDV